MLRCVLGLLLILSVSPLFAETSRGSWSIFGARPTVFTAEDVEYIPGGSHTGSILEYWYLPAVSSNADTGGLALTEKQLLNAQGSSALWQKFSINQSNVNHPFHVGQPLVDVPSQAFDRLHVKTVVTPFSAGQGYDFKLNAPPKPTRRWHINLAHANLLGGANFMPRKTFDREPGEDWGAPAKQRAFKPSFEVSGSYDTFLFNNLPGKIFAESVLHNRTFIKKNYEFSSRQTALYTQGLGKGRQALLAYQLKSRQNEGVEWQNESNATTSLLSNVVYGQYQDVNRATSLRLGLGLAGESTTDQGVGIVRSFSEEINHSPVLPTGQQYSMFVDGQLDFSQINLAEFLPRLYNKNHLRVESVHEKTGYLENYYARTYNGQANDVTVYGGPQWAHTYLVQASPTLGYAMKTASLELDAWVGLAYGAGFSQQRLLLQRLDPTAGIKTTFLFKGIDSELFIGAQHDAVPLTYHEVGSLNRRRLSGTRYFWSDSNADGAYQPGEEGSVLNRTGPAFHDAGQGLNAPVSEELTIGFLKNFSRRWSTLLQFHARVIRNLFKYQFDPNFNANYNAVSRSESFTGTFYNRNAGSYGEEVYLLENSQENSYYGAAEVQVIRKNINSWWHLSANLGAYIQLANPIAGNGPFKNDIGYVDDSSADPNNDLASEGRTEHDRGFLINIIFGFDLYKGLTFDHVIRYRDGTPFGSVIVAEGLVQGPTIIMDQKRANGLEGVGRYTFYLNWDARLRYEWHINEQQWALALDVYNVMGSSVPMYEVLQRGTFLRRPTENIPDRMVRILLSASF